MPRDSAARGFARFAGPWRQNRRNLGLRHFLRRLYGRSVPDGARQARDRRRHHRGRTLRLLGEHFRQHDTGCGHGNSSISARPSTAACSICSASGASPTPAELAKKAEERAERARSIRSPTSSRDRIYLFTGTSDHTVAPSIVKDAGEFYAKLGVPEANIKLVSTVPAGHAFVTDDEGSACEVSGEPYVVDCHYDQAGELLKHIYGNLATARREPERRLRQLRSAPVRRRRGQRRPRRDGRRLRSEGLSRKSGLPGPHRLSRLCAESREPSAIRSSRSSGFARWADTNRFIVLFPQVAASPINPQGCWDWWGYTGPQYLTRDAPQIAAVNRMLDALQGPGGGA